MESNKGVFRCSIDYYKNDYPKNQLLNQTPGVNDSLFRRVQGSPVTISEGWDPRILLRVENILLESCK